MRYLAAPMLPDRRVVGDGLGDGRGVLAALWGGVHEAISSVITTRTRTRFMSMKPQPPRRNSDVGARLTAVDRYARAVQEARLL